MQLLNCHLLDLCSIDYYIDSFFSFAFDAKETKNQGKNPDRSGRLFSGPAHKGSDYLKCLYWFYSGWCKTLLPAMAGTERHYVPPC